MPSTLRTLEQERAKYAWECVQQCLDHAIKQLKMAIEKEQDQRRKNELAKRLQNLQKSENEWKGKYGSVVRRLPSYILTNGLGQTLAFLKAKGKGEPDSEHEILYQHLAGWLQKQLSINGDFLDWLVKTATSQQYRLATMEALALLQWLKRFAEAELPKGSEE